jgi:ribosomal RNA assembly protein
MMQATYDVRIPKERIAVLIGSKGAVKKSIQNATGTLVDVDSKEGIVTVSGEDALRLMDSQNVIKAIARGFNPDIALLLLKQDYCFELIDLKLVSRNKNDMERLKGRIIGEGGKSRKTIEGLTDSYICVFGKTVGIIGEMAMASMCKRAVTMLISGSNHATVYRWLESQRRKLRRGDFEF